MVSSSLGIHHLFPDNWQRQFNYLVQISACIHLIKSEPVEIQHKFI